MQARRDRLLQKESHDPTRPSRKLPDPTVCPDCGATYIEGRWTWRRGPVEAPRHRCSGCQRAQDDYPAGLVTIAGEFTRLHRYEILRIARRTEARERETHPINRIMRVSNDEENLILATTEFHLAQAIGRSLHSAFSGELNIDYAEDIIRVSWRREE